MDRSSREKPKLAFIDHVGAIVVSILILKVCWDILTPSISELADRGASQKGREKIRSIAMGVDGVKSVHAVRTRSVGCCSTFGTICKNGSGHYQLILKRGNWVS